MAPSTILLVDSDTDSTAIYSMILEHHGYTVVHASEPEIGVELALETGPDVVISELFLPGVRSARFLERLRSNERTATTPLIIFDSAPGLVRRAADQGPVLIRLTKPCEPSRVLLEVQRLLAKSATVAAPMLP